MAVVSKSFMAFAVVVVMSGIAGSAVAAPPPDATYRSAAAFDAALTGGQSVETFDGFADGATVSSALGGIVLFPAPLPMAFQGGWSGGVFSGRALVSRPTFTSAPIVMNFPAPVSGVGANAWDDMDGTPRVAQITLRAITSDGDTLTIAEDVNAEGDTGFLGATAASGIVRALFSIDASGSNLEIDRLKVGQLTVVPVRASTWGRVKSLYKY